MKQATRLATTPYEDPAHEDDSDTPLAPSFEPRGEETATLEPPPPPRDTPTRPTGPIGPYLQSVREQQGMSVDEAARELYLEPRILHALEAEDLDKLPPMIFIQGYLRSYAKLLQQDPDALVKQFINDQSAITPKSGGPKLTAPRARPVEPAMKSPGIKLQTGLLFVVLMLLMVLWRQTSLHRNAPSPLVNEPEAVAVTPEVEEPQLPESGDADLPPLGYTPPTEAVEEPPVEASEDTENPESPQDTASALTDGTEDPPVEDPPAPTRQFYLKFKARCWTSVKDASGKTYYSKVGSPGEEILIEEGATPPFKLVFGNPSGVDQLEVLGENHDMASYRGGIPAKLTLGEPD